MEASAGTAVRIAVVAGMATDNNYGGEGLANQTIGALQLRPSRVRDAGIAWFVTCKDRIFPTKPL